MTDPNDNELRPIITALETLETHWETNPTAGLKPNYPDHYTPTYRVDHVLHHEYPKWRSPNWITQAANIEPTRCRHELASSITAGKLAIGPDGVRLSPYVKFYKDVQRAAESVDRR